MALMQEDVLYYVFEHASHDHILAQAAAVCRAWTIPAQAALYRELEYSPLACRPREALLARTLRTRPHLLRFVRRLYLVTAWTHSPIPDLCEWIKHIPPDLLHDYCWTWERGHPVPSLMSFPGIRGARHIKLKGRLYSMDSIQPILELPYLQALSLELKGDETGSLSDTSAPKIRRLNVIAHEGYSRALHALLSAVGPQLESLHLTTKLGDDLEKDALLVSCIVTHCPDLKRLDIEATAPPPAPVPIVDGIVRGCRSLEHLRCMEGTFTPGLLRVIPPGLRVLRLPYDPVCEDLLLDLVEDARARRGGLATLDLIGSGGDAQQYQRFADSCRASDVSFGFSSV